MKQLQEALGTKFERDAIRHAIVCIARDLCIPELSGLLAQDALVTADLQKLMTPETIDD